MLPKPDKKSKRISSQQLDLVETISDAGKIQKKRRTLIVFLALTIGLSFCFLAYRHLQEINLKEIKVPSLSLKIPSVVKSDFTPKTPQNWVIEILPFEATSTAQNTNPSPYAKKYLPSGALVTEKTNSALSYFEINSSISTPKTSFQVYAKIPGNISSTSSELDQYSKLVEEIYWHQINTEN